MNKQVALKVSLIAGVFVLVVAGFFVLRDESPDIDLSATSAERGISESTINDVADLEAVNEYKGEARAYRTYDPGSFVHRIEVNFLSDPAEGKFYEGWLVGSSVVSTGMLEQSEEGVWNLSFTSTEDLASHDEIVITEETLANGLDGNQETRMFEGTF